MKYLLIALIIVFGIIGFAGSAEAHHYHALVTVHALRTDEGMDIKYVSISQHNFDSSIEKASVFIGRHVDVVNAPLHRLTLIPKEVSMKIPDIKGLKPGIYEVEIRLWYQGKLRYKLVDDFPIGKDKP